MEEEEDGEEGEEEEDGKEDYSDHSDIISGDTSQDTIQLLLYIIPLHASCHSQLLGYLGQTELAYFFCLSKLSNYNKDISAV